MLPKLFSLCFSSESLDTKILERVEARPCEASLGAIFCRFLVSGSFAARGDKREE
jgi:hypothetical protein